MSQRKIGIEQWFKKNVYSLLILVYRLWDEAKMKNFPNNNGIDRDNNSSRSWQLIDK